jgi:hypothetical protein
MAAALAGVTPGRGVPAEGNPCLDRTVAVTVTTEDGRLVKGLVAANFRATSRGHAVRIVSATYDTGPRRIVLLFDTSGSVIGDKALMSVSLKVAEDLVSAAPPQCSMAFLTFAGNVEDRVTFSEGRQAVVDEIAKLRDTQWSRKGPERRTALFDALLEGVSLLRPMHSGDALYLLSDGGEYGSRTSPSELSRALLSVRVRLFGFVTVAPEVGEVEGNRLPSILSEIAAPVAADFVVWTPKGGWTQLLSSSYVLGAAANDPLVKFASQGLLREISELYQLEVRLPQAPKKPLDWRLDVVSAETGKVSKDLKLIYPHKLAACEP